MKKSIMILVLVILSSYSVFAHDDLIVTHEIVQDKVLNGDEFVFKVNIENKQNVSDTFRFYSPTTFWEWIFNIEPKQIKLDAESSDDVVLKLEPYDGKDPGNYAITLNIVSNNDSEILTEHSFDVEILDYNDVIDVDLELPKVIDVDEDNLFRISLTSNYWKSIPNISVNFKSDYFDETGKSHDLVDEFENEFLINFGQNVEVADINLQTNVYRDGKLVIEKTQNLLR